jgi:deoxycytidylate deaminase
MKNHIRKKVPQPKLPFGMRMARVGMLKSAHKIKVGAALVSKGKIIVAWNMTKTSPAALRHNYRWADQAHAEFNLFSHTVVPGDTEGTVFVIRELADGSLATAKPCDKCREFLKFMGIKRIVYSMYNEIVKEKI